jgi:hypothetical protein
MTLAIGKHGSLRLRRSSAYEWTEIVHPEDVNRALNRVGFESAIDNLLVGDRVIMETDDPRGLAFIAPLPGFEDQPIPGGTHYIHVNAMGGLRLFRELTDAINNNRAQEVALVEFEGAPIEVRCTIRDTVFNELGLVSRWTFDTDREAIDSSTLEDRFKQLFDAGLISGAGTIDSSFATSLASQPPGRIPEDAELPLMMLQTLQRIEVGSSFDAALHITDVNRGADINLFYAIKGVITKGGIDVSAAEITKVSINFMTTGEFHLLVGNPKAYILMEDESLIQTERGDGFLLKEESD